MFLAENGLVPPCAASTLWDHINGWEVVVSVLLIMGGWTLTNIARMHFMVQMAATKHHHPQDGEIPRST